MNRAVDQGNDAFLVPLTLPVCSIHMDYARMGTEGETLLLICEQQTGRFVTSEPTDDRIDYKRNDDPTRDYLTFNETFSPSHT